MCTTITFRNDDGSFTYGRTMEWGAFDMASRATVVPTGVDFVGATPDGAPGRTWTSRIPVLGIDIVHRDGALADGINADGLVVGLLYHPGFARYADYDPTRAADTIGPVDLATFLLTQCATVTEARAALEGVVVAPVVDPMLGVTPPVHLIVVDSTGAAITIEFDGGLRVFDNPLRVLTNAPTFDWHEINIRNYVNLSPVAVPARELASVDFAPIGAGAGFLGLPGDFTPPSRFVRAVAWSQTKRLTTDALDGVDEVFRELDNMNVPLGAAEGSDLDSPPPPSPGTSPMRSATLWTVAYDITGRTMFFHTQHNRRVRSVALDRIDTVALGSTIAAVPLDPTPTQDVEDRTAELAAPGRHG